MAEPWLDSLSEDWKSETQSSSPHVESLSRPRSASGLSTSRSRIPHLQHSLRKESVGGGYLKPRSQRGLARTKTTPALSERSPSSLNVPRVQDERRAADDDKLEASTIPRRPSSAFSESQSSVKHLSLRKSQSDHHRETPDWKKRLVQREAAVGENVDLFSPSKLEGMFNGPSGSERNTIEDRNTTRSDRPWSFFNLPPTSTAQESLHTFKTSRGRPPVMEVVLEETEDGLSPPHPTSPRLQTEQHHNSRERQSSDSKETVNSNDSRLRTASGREEIQHEEISPVTMSKQNSITSRALQQSIDFRGSDVRAQLEALDINDLQRPSSSSSDAGVAYGGFGRLDRQGGDDSRLDMTTTSLPDDLSMGTQDFAAQGGFVNHQRGHFVERISDVHDRSVSNVLSPSVLSLRPQYFRSSPPSNHTTKLEDLDLRHTLDSRGSDSMEASVVHHTGDAVEEQVAAPSSPLKLFGARDTYTNNKLLRVLSHFDGNSANREPHLEECLDPADDNENHRMSHFGRGDLDYFGFSQNIDRPHVQEPQMPSTPRTFRHNSGLPPPKPATDKLDIVSKSKIPVPKAQGPNMLQPNNMADGGKRLPNSPRKDPTPKRRKTLLRDEIQLPDNMEELRTGPALDAAQLAGTKHKHSRSDFSNAAADPNVLASRSLLRPRTARRRSSVSAQQALDQVKASANPPATPDADTRLTEALAAELASFTHGMQDNAADSRKPSIATKDYLEEANKVMQFIRARGKPMVNMERINEPTDVSELNADAILDLDIDLHSTMDNFSRPPSRERRERPNGEQRKSELDPRQISILRKFKDDEDTVPLEPDQGILGAKFEPDTHNSEPSSRQESSPVNIRILNHDDVQRKRKLSESTVDPPVTSTRDANNPVQGSSDSTRRTFPTASSNSSGQKGMITHGSIPIPDQVGTMTFDHKEKVWVDQNKAKSRGEEENKRRSQIRVDGDPFEDIPDLSIGDQVDQSTKPPAHNILPGKLSVAGPRDTNTAPTVANDIPEAQHPNVAGGLRVENQDTIRSQLSDHELKIHDGVASRPPRAAKEDAKQPRVVTIAFSSPLISAIRYPKEPEFSEEELAEIDELPLDDSGITASSPYAHRAYDWAEKVRSTRDANIGLSKYDDYDENQEHNWTSRAISRIDEVEEDDNGAEGLSLVHLKDSKALATPAHNVVQLIEHALVPSHRKQVRDCSLIALTPLSEFSYHQNDTARHPEESYVAERTQPKALRQAHGALALGEDELVRAITDAEQSEIFWDDERKLDLSGRHLVHLNGLEQYCGKLEDLNAQDNQLSHLKGVPHTMRVLDVASNMLSNLTSWQSLHNLQYLEISNNQLDNLDGLSSLVHLRDLSCRDNNVQNIDGLFELDALLNVDLSGNNLSVLNLEGCRLGRLEKLSLRNNQLTSLRSLHLLTSLEELDLSQNKLSEFSIPRDAVMANLRRLLLAGNLFEGFDFEALPGLEELDMDRNAVDELMGLQSARTLKVLSVREQSNAPHILDLVMSTPNACQTLFLSSNVIENDEGLLRLPHLPQYNLRHLELACCGITQMPTGFGDAFPNCENLCLSSNAIKDIDPLRGMTNLAKIDLAGNRIKRLRRTCLLLMRLGNLDGATGGGGLQEIDIRANPLSLGFYAPDQSSTQNLAMDAKYRHLMDETTAMKRRMVELLLRQGCPQLHTLNGVPTTAPDSGYGSDGGPANCGTGNDSGHQYRGEKTTQHYEGDKHTERGAIAGEDRLVTDKIWDRLMGKGVLMKVIEQAK